MYQVTWCYDNNLTDQAPLIANQAHAHMGGIPCEKVTMKHSSANNATSYSRTLLKDNLGNETTSATVIGPSQQSDH